MSEVTVLLVRKRALDKSALTEAITKAVEDAWQRHSPPRRRGARRPACKWIAHLDELRVVVSTSPEAAQVLRPFGFGLIRETIRPLWRLAREDRGAFELTECGVSVLQVANRSLCEQDPYAQLGVWRALATGSRRPPGFSANEEAIAEADLQRMRTQNNQLFFVKRVSG